MTTFSEQASAFAMRRTPEWHRQQIRAALAAYRHAVQIEGSVTDAGWLAQRLQDCTESAERGER